MAIARQIMRHATAGADVQKSLSEEMMIVTRANMPSACTDRALNVSHQVLT